MKRKPVILIVVVFSIIVLAVALFKIFYFHIVSLVLDIPAPEYSVVVNKDIMVPMRDGTLLATDIYRPDTNGSYPLIITRTPYGKDNPEHKYSFAGKLFASQGYVFLCQDVRGKFNSEGDFYPYL
ncbi:MAG: CocE/NonD family hydrolase, partial [Spirochaetota bacterium]